MKTLFYLILIANCSLFIANCSDSSNPSNPTPPTAQDSIVILIGPADDTVFTFTPDSIRVFFTWINNNYAIGYEIQWDTDSNFFNFPAFIYSDSTSVSQKFNTPFSNVFWHIRIFRSSSPYAPWSETRRFTIQ